MNIALLGKHRQAAYSQKQGTLSSLHSVSCLTRRARLTPISYKNYRIGGTPCSESELKYPHPEHPYVSVPRPACMVEAVQGVRAYVILSYLELIEIMV